MGGAGVIATILHYALTFGFGMLFGSIWSDAESETSYAASAILIAASGLLLIGMKLASL
jgi:hypothetical protein